MNISEMQQMVFEINLANGWFDKPRSFGSDIALLHSEVSEMFEAWRKHEGSEAIGKEAADILIRLLDTCERMDIPLEKYFLQKCEINRARGYRHGNRAV